MKRIIFVRHAKTEPWDFGMEDFDRKLTNRGHSDSEIMASSLIEENLIPQLIYSSSAVRALQTSRLFADNLHLPKTIISDLNSLYEYVSTQDIQDLIEKADNEMNTIMIVGHNPWISSVTSMLSKNFHAMLPTCGTVVLEYKAEQWKDIQPGAGKLKYYKTPKNFK